MFSTTHWAHSIWTINAITILLHQQHYIGTNKVNTCLVQHTANAIGAINDMTNLLHHVPTHSLGANNILNV